METSEELVTVGDGNTRSRKRTRNETDREKRKKARYSDPFAATSSFQWKTHPCKHCDNGTRSVYNCFKVTERDVVAFREKLFSNSSKVDQDNFLLMCTKVNPAIRRRIVETDRKRNRSQSCEFRLKAVNGSSIRVCRQTFEAAVNPIGKTRITGVMKRSYFTGQIAQENRGGDRVKDKNLDRKNSVRNFLRSLKARESHYGRSKSVRLYLPSELKNIRNLHKMYNNVSDAPCVTFAMFYEIFSKEFNLGFNNPRVDVCTTCENIRTRIKMSQGDDVKTLQQQLKIHKKRSKAFYNIIRQKTEDPDTHVIVFDLQQVQVLPKVPIQEAYYSRQLGLYNFAICDTTKNKNYSYTWTENQSERGGQ